MRVYLAGKIAASDWRHAIVGSALRLADGNADWRTQEIAFDRNTYVGPFFSGCDHGCSHSLGEHGITLGQCEADRGDAYPERENEIVGMRQERRFKAPAQDIASGENSDVNHRRAMLVDKCKKAIDSAGLVFCWLDDATAHGSIWEMGYAIGRGVQVFVGLPAELDASDLWFPIYGASHVIRAPHAGMAFAEALRFFGSKSESPIEEKMRTALLAALPPHVEVEQQVPACGGRYRLDFGITAPNGQRLAVECDGHDFHERTKEQARNDKSRDRALTAEGWKVLRFTGSEIFKDARRCAGEVAKIVRQEATR